MPAKEINDKIYFDQDASLKVIQSKKVAIIGYGNQGRAQALNLVDSGVDVRVGLRDNSKSIDIVENDGLKSYLIESVVSWADVVCCLLPDQCI